MSYKSLAQGQGVSTEFKERGLQAAFWINLSIYQNKFGHLRYRYWHVDMNSGNGMNEEVGCIGSPLALLQAAQDAGCNRLFAAFCDLDDRKLAVLFNREELQRDDCFPFNGNNSELLYALPEIIKEHGENPKMAVGMVLADPNGADIPLEAMEWLSYECPKIDFVVNWNSARAKGHRVNPIYGGDHFPTLQAAISRMNKAHWLIRQPLSAHQFTLLIGRNFKVGDHRTLGFYHLESPIGQEILRRCNYTKLELAAIKDERMEELPL